MDYRQQIFDALKAKNFGVSDDILMRVAKALAKNVTSAEQVATVVEGVTIQRVVEISNDSRATEASETAVRNYETQHGLKNGKPIDGGGAAGGSPQPAGGTTVTTTQPAGGTDTQPQWVQSLLDGYKTLTDRLDRMEGERTTATRKQQLDTIVEKLPENLRKPYSHVAVDSLTDEQWNTLIGEVTTEVEGLVGDISAKGAVFGKPSATHGGASSQDGKLTKEQEDAIAHREGAPNSGQQPF